MRGGAEHQGESALAAAAATTMATVKRGPSGGSMEGPGSRARNCTNVDGDAGRRAAPEILAAREQEIDEMRRRLQEIDEMRRRLQELEKLDCEILPVASHEEEPKPAIEAVATVEKAEVDARSIYVGNVDYACSPEEVQQHFQFCGTINRVTILTDSFGQPKGFAYVEFLEADAVQKALLLNETELHGRPLKVSPKRTNIPGMRQSRGRRVPRFRRSLAYSPYY